MAARRCGSDLTRTADRPAVLPDIRPFRHFPAQPALTIVNLIPAIPTMSKIKRLFSAVFAVVLLSVPVTRTLAVNMPAPAIPASGITAEFKQVFERIAGKLKAGQKTEAELTPEVAAIDALLAKYAADKSDEVAMVALMKARLYLEVFENTEKGIALLKAIKADFPQGEIAKNIDEAVAAIEKEATAAKALAVGQTFPAFAEKDLGGQPLSVAAFKGKVVLVDFWATWCGPCVGELPNVIAAYEKYHAKGFEVIGISLDKSRDELTAFIKEKNMKWAQYFDGLGWDNKLSSQCGIRSIPATFLLDGEGKIIAKDLRGPALDSKLAELLK
jgi:thiol-disulfide isomerase/thioredoxin